MLLLEMATSNSTLASLWVEDGQSSPLRTLPTTPSKGASNGAELKDDVLRFYKDSGLENMAKDAGILDANGELLQMQFKTENVQSSKGTIQMIAVPVSSPSKSPFKIDAANVMRGGAMVSNTGTVHMSGSPMIIGQAPTPQRLIHATQVMTPKGAAQIVTTQVHVDSPQAWTAASNKRPAEAVFETEYESKRKKGEKGGKGLRHFSMKVCEKVQNKGVTSYNEVADELVNEFSDPRNMPAADQVRDIAYDQKNIRRRVYDALNVLMAMNIISKEKKEIRWIGLPTNSAQECENLELEKQRRTERIKHKTQQLQELILQQIAFKNLVQRNRQLEVSQGPPTSNSAIQLPFIIVNTSKKTVIDCSISNDKYEYLFNFDNTFEIHDDIEVLKRMGMAYGLEKHQCSPDNLKKAVRMVPKSLEPYVLELANHKSGFTMGSSYIKSEPSAASGSASTSRSYASIASPLATPLQGTSDQSLDAEVAMATNHGLSRQSSMASMPSRDSPGNFSEDSDSVRSSPVDIN